MWRRFVVPAAVVFLLTSCFLTALTLANTDLFKSDPRIAMEVAQERQFGQLRLQQAQAERPFVLALVGTGVLVACGVLVLVAYNWHLDKAATRRRLAPTAFGYPLPDPTTLDYETTIELTALLTAGHMQAQVEQARNSFAVPERLTYAPKLTSAPPAGQLVASPPNDAAAQLPVVAPLAEVLSTLPPGHIAYGKTAQGLLVQPLGRGYHGLYHGRTQSGKTTAIDSMLVQLHAMAASGMPLLLFAGDFKRQLAATWNRSPLFAGRIQTEPTGILDMLAELVHGTDGIRARYQRFEQVGNETGRIIRSLDDYIRVTGEQLPRAVVFIDEMNALLDAARKQQELEGTLKQALQMGAGAGYYLMGGAQRLNAAILGTDGRDQFVTRAHFGAYDPTVISMLFGKVKHDELQPLLDGTAGRGLIATTGHPYPQAFQALNCTEQDILTAIASISPSGNPATPPLEMPSMAPECPETAGMEGQEGFPDMAQNSPEMAVQSLPAVISEVSELDRIQILALGKAGVPRTQICEQLYGSPGGREYAKVKALLDAEGL